jgi:hypothetical protein
MQWLLVIVIAVAACIGYGVLHDQITARICVEYFTVGHAPIIGTDDPTLLGLGWGVLGTWWVGLLLGVPLATFARIGKRPQRSPLSLVPPILVLLMCTAIVAALAGAVGFIAALNGWVWLVPGIASRLPQERHTPFLVALWMHNASYTAGFVGGVLLMAWVWWTRIAMATKDAPGKMVLRDPTSPAR